MGEHDIEDRLAAIESLLAILLAASFERDPPLRSPLLLTMRRAVSALRTAGEPGTADALEEIWDWAQTLRTKQ